MVSKYNYKNITWIDLESPTLAEILDVKDEFEIPELIAEELNTCTLRSKVDFYDKKKLLYLVLHFPVIDESGKCLEQEFDLILGHDFLLTARYEKIAYFNSLSHVFTTSSFFEKNRSVEHAGHLFIHILRELYKNSLGQLEDINDSLKKIEEQIFAGKQAQMVEQISVTNRLYVNFKQTLRHHGEIWNSFSLVAPEIFGREFSHNANILQSENNRVRNTLEIGREILNDLRVTNDSILETHTNQTIKTLTGISFTLLPITLITGIFGMNAPQEAFFIRTKEDFILVIILIVILWVVMMIFFKLKKWL